MEKNKVTLQSVFSASPEKVYKAFTDADAMAFWIPPQEGIPDAISTEMCYVGWQVSLDKLNRLVEPNI